MNPEKDLEIKFTFSNQSLSAYFVDGEQPMDWRQSISLVSFLSLPEYCSKAAMSCPLKSCVQGSFFQDTIKTNLQNTVFLCFERHRTGHNTNSQKGMVKSTCILHPAHRSSTWQTHQCLCNLWGAGTLSPYNCQTLSHLPESWVPGILLPQMSHEWGLGNSTLTVFILIYPTFWCREGTGSRVGFPESWHLVETHSALISPIFYDHSISIYTFSLKWVILALC